MREEEEELEVKEAQRSPSEEKEEAEAAVEPAVLYIKKNKSSVLDVSTYVGCLVYTHPSGVSVFKALLLSLSLSLAVSTRARTKRAESSPCVPFPTNRSKSV